jgi:predicted N-acetyltransferase YhbS
VRHHSARTFVLTDDGETIVGYYALSSHSVDVDAISSQLARGQLQRYPIPAVLLARLAVAVDYQGSRLGERLLADAVQRVVKASDSIGIALLAVDALDDRAAGFYEKYGLERWPVDSLRLFARVKDIAATFAH